MTAATALDGRPDVEGLARARLHGILAALVSDPARLLDPTRLRDARDAALGRADLLRGLADLDAAVAPLRARPRELEREYVRLFVKSEAPPYEGSYMSGARLAHELADVSGFLRAFGLRPRGERPDHLATELEFLAFVGVKEWIAERNGQGPEARVCRDARAAFLRDHLGRWVGAHARAVRERASGRVYPILLGVIEAVVAQDAALLGLAPEPATEARPDVEDPLRGCGLAR